MPQIYTAVLYTLIDFKLAWNNKWQQKSGAEWLW